VNEAVGAIDRRAEEETDAFGLEPQRAGHDLEDQVHAASFTKAPASAWSISARVASIP